MEREKLVKKMMKGQFTLQELGIKFQDILELRAAGYRISSHHEGGKRLYYIIVNSETDSVFISGLSPKEQTIRWVEMSDLHCGSMQFDEQGLRNCLHQAWGEGFKEVHIAGDSCDGYKLYYGHLNNLRLWTAQDQAEKLASILVEYPFHYYAIHGNHCHSFEKAGSPNPNKLVEQMMEGSKAQFTYLPSFAGDLIIAGVGMRMVHLLGGRIYSKSYPGQVYIRNLLDSHGENVFVRGNKYRLRFLSLGHYHFDISFESAGIYVTHPGNFQFPNDYTIRQGLIGYQGCRFTTAVIKNGQVLDYDSRFVKPKR